MTALEDIKQKLEKAIGIWRPSANDATAAVRKVRAKTLRFADNGTTPNNPTLPLTIYMNAIKFAKRYDPAAVIETLFEINGWGDGWRDGIYDFMHFHTKTHEALGIARGNVWVRFGGTNGEEIDLAAGDVVILPAGTGHQKIKASADLLVVGAYPPNGEYDECKRATTSAAMKAIKSVPLPKSDPIYGKRGGIMKIWKAKPKTRR